MPKLETQNSISQRPSVGSSQIGMATKAMTTMPKLETQNSIHDHRRMQSGSAPPFASNTPSQQNSIPWIPPTSKEQGLGSFSSLGYVKHEPSDNPGSHRQKVPITIFHGLPSVPTGPLDIIPVPPASKPLGTGFSTNTHGVNLCPEALSTSYQSANSQLTPSLPVSNAKAPSKKPAVVHPCRPLVRNKSYLEAQQIKALNNSLVLLLLVASTSGKKRSSCFLGLRKIVGSQKHHTKLYKKKKR